MQQIGHQQPNFQVTIAALPLSANPCGFVASVLDSAEDCDILTKFLVTGATGPAYSPTNTGPVGYTPSVLTDASGTVAIISATGSYYITGKQVTGFASVFIQPTSTSSTSPLLFSLPLPVGTAMTNLVVGSGVFDSSLAGPIRYRTATLSLVHDANEYVRMYFTANNIAYPDYPTYLNAEYLPSIFWDPAGTPTAWPLGVANTVTYTFTYYID